MESAGGMEEEDEVRGGRGEWGGGGECVWEE